MSDAALFHCRFQAAAADFDLPELQMLTSATHASREEAEAEKSEIVKYLYHKDCKHTLSK